MKPVLLNPRPDQDTTRFLSDVLDGNACVCAGVSEPPPEAPGPGLIVGTSGSTGEPKLVFLPTAAVLTAAEIGSEALDADPGDEWWCPLPLTHLGGLLVVLRSLWSGGTVSFEPFDPENLHGDHTSMVPTMLFRIAKAGGNLDSFRSVLVGGGGTDPSVLEAVGGNVIRTYGLTETCGGVVWNGKPLAGIGLRIAEDGREIQLGGATLMSGYLNRRNQPFTSDGWLQTNDSGELKDGNLTVHGRLDTAIRTGGETVYPEVVERVLEALDGVDRACVVGVPDPEWGERVVAAFTGDADEEALKSGCVHLRNCERPKGFYRLEEMPLTGIGKVERDAVRRMLP